MKYIKMCEMQLGVKGKFTLKSTREEITEINDFSFHLKKLEKQEQGKTKVSRRKEIRKIRVKIC